MIERWISLEKEKGNELFRKMIQDLKMKFKYQRI